jgi:L-rhamnose mutarotase
MRIALHTRVRPDRVEEYEAAHREVPPDLVAAIKAGGAREWTIWRSGVELFHVLECDDPAAMFASLEGLPAQIAWAARMAELVDASSGLSADGEASGLPVVWSLTAE